LYLSEDVAKFVSGIETQVKTPIDLISVPTWSRAAGSRNDPSRLDREPRRHIGLRWSHDRLFPARCRAIQPEAAIAMTKRALIRISTFLVVLSLWSVIAPTSAKAGPIVYVTGLGNEFGTLDLATGAFNPIATLKLSGGDFIFGMGFGSDGKLYGLDAQPNASLYQINPLNGDLVNLGQTGMNVAGATSDASGEFYAISQDSNAVYSTLTPPSTTSSMVGPIGFSSDGLMAVSADGSQLFTTVTDGTSGNSDLFSLNPTTGAASVLGDTGFFVDAGLFVGGTLYGFDTTSNAIVTLDTTTGVGTQVATYFLPNGDPILSAAVAPAVVPEPSSVILMGLGLAGAVGYFRHRRRARDQS
jgi:PEP-CTERM motif